MKENIKFQLRQLEDMAGDNVELQKKVSQFVSDALNELEEHVFYTAFICFSLWLSSYYPY